MGKRRTLWLQIGSDGGTASWCARVAAAREAGFAGIEWILPHAVGSEGAGTTGDPEDTPVSIAAQFALPVCALGLHCTSTDPAVLVEQGRAAIATAGRLGAAMVSIMLPPVSQGEAGGLTSYQDGLNAAYTMLHALRFEAAAAGVVLALTAPQEGFLFSPVEARELIDTVNAWNVGLCIDAEAASRFGVPGDWIDRLGARVRAVRTACAEKRQADVSGFLPDQTWLARLPEDTPIIVTPSTSPDGSVAIV